MATRKRKIKKKYSFLESWGRVKKNTPLENFIQLSEIVETSESNITKRKNEDNFPIEWAFMIARKYGLTTEWILTGEGKRELTAEDTFFHELEMWGKEIGNSENITWLKNQIEVAFPAFKKWKEEKEEAERATATFPSSKIA